MLRGCYFEVSTDRDPYFLDSMTKNPFHFINNIVNGSDTKTFFLSWGFNYGCYLAIAFGFSHNLKNILN